jgi:hypothetical protein
VLTASGERCYLHGDSRPDQLFYNGGNGIVTTAMDGESSLEATLRSPQSAESASVVTELPCPLIHVNDSNDYDHLFEDYDHLEDLSPPPPSPPSLPAQNGISPAGARRTNRIGSVDFEKVPEIDGGKLEVNSISRQELWKNSIVEVESDSDSEAVKDTTATKLTTNDGGPPQNLEKANSTPSPSHLAPPPSTTAATSNLYSDIEAVSPVADADKIPTNESSNYYNFSVLVSQMHYANVFIPGPGGNAYGGSSAPVKRARPRSKSSSPQTPKKPVPLPRRVTAGAGGNALLTNGSDENSKSTVASEKKLFVESLPANFRPQPPPKPSSLAGLSPKVATHQPNILTLPAACMRLIR